MKHGRAAARPLKNPEVVINLWAYAGEDGTVLRLSGKTYVMQGSDAEKLALLRQLAASDFLGAPWHKVPANFTISHPAYGVMRGAAQTSMLSDPQYHETLFGPLIEHLARTVPEQLSCADGEYKVFRLELPQEPLLVSTIVMENEDGTLLPMIAD